MNLKEMSEAAEREAKSLRLYKDLGVRAKAYMVDLQAHTVDLMALIADVRVYLETERTFHAWAEEYLGWDEDKANKGLRIGRWINAVRDRAPEITAEIPPEMSKLDELRMIPDPHIIEFRGMHPDAFGFMSTDRDTIREYVRAFLVEKGLKKPKPAPEQMDFFASLRLPPPEEFSEMVQKQTAAIDPNKARFYGCTLMFSAIAARDSMTPEDRSELNEDVLALVGDAFGAHVHDIVKQILDSKRA